MQNETIIQTIERHIWRLRFAKERLEVINLSKASQETKDYISIYYKQEVQYHSKMIDQLSAEHDKGLQK